MPRYCDNIDYSMNRRDFLARSGLGLGGALIRFGGVAGFLGRARSRFAELQRLDLLAAPGHLRRRDQDVVDILRRLAEMALQAGDTDLCTLAADHLFPSCTTWIVLRRESVLRDYMLEFIHQFAPHLDRRDVARTLTGDTTIAEWPNVPHWRRNGTNAVLEAA